MLRIVDIGYVMAKPLPGVDECFVPLSAEAATQMPVVRIYGATPAGQKALLHLHGVRSDIHWRLNVSMVAWDTLCRAVVCVWCRWMGRIATWHKLYFGWFAANLQKQHFVPRNPHVHVVCKRHDDGEFTEGHASSTMAAPELRELSRSGDRHGWQSSVSVRISIVDTGQVPA